jgi:hypothetical protein
MSKRRTRRRLFQFSVRALVLETVAVSMSAGLLRYAALSLGRTDFGTYHFLAGVAGVMIAGAAIGAPIGHALEDERGGVALMGIYVGAIVAPLLLILVLPVVFVLWRFFLW